MKQKPRTILLLILFMVVACPSLVRAEWAILGWAEAPPKNQIPAHIKPQEAAEFVHVLSFDCNRYEEGSWSKLQEMLREGDLIAYREEKWEARRDILLKGHLNKLGYRLFRYGHLALVVRDPEDQNTLRLFSSQAFIGPNIRESIETLKQHSWDAYRLNLWERVDKARLYEFIRLARDKAEKWYGYDFSGMLGVWNSNLRPKNAKDIGHDYICSTIVLAALHYAGLELNAERRRGIADIVTPLQVVTSSGRIKSTQDSAGTEDLSLWMSAEVNMTTLKESEHWITTWDGTRLFYRR